MESHTLEQIKTILVALEVEDAKFVAGNSAAGTRARNMLSEVGKLVKARRKEITDEKAARKAAAPKKAPKAPKAPKVAKAPKAPKVRT